MQHIVASTAAIYNPTRGSLCAAVWVAEDMLMTAAHCVSDLEPGDSMQLKVSENAKVEQAEVVAAMDTKDLALLRCHSSYAHMSAAIAPADPQQGDEVFVVGHPVGEMFSFSAGHVAAIRTEGEEVIYQTTAPISPGNSGGGMFDLEGRLLAIASRVHLRGTNIGYFVSVVR